MAALFFGSMGIFPLTQLGVRLIGRPGKVSPGNGLWALGSQVAFTVPLSFLLVGAATLYREAWFFPAAMIVVGSHYLPFITLYGMRMFGVLAALLVIAGAGLAMYGPEVFGLGGWLTGVLLMTFAFAGLLASLLDLVPFSAMFDASQVVYSVILGLFYGVCYARSRSMAYPMVMHSFTNVLAVGAAALAGFVFG
jgi:hypothetical protein